MDTEIKSLFIKSNLLYSEEPEKPMTHAEFSVIKDVINNLKIRSDCWKNVFDLCYSLGMELNNLKTGREMVLDFIKDLHNNKINKKQGVKMDISKNKKMLVESLGTLNQSCLKTGGSLPDLSMTLSEFISSYGWNGIIFTVSKSAEIKEEI